jgi:hypothetical protein
MNEITLDPVAQYFADAQWSPQQYSVSKEYITDMPFDNDDSSSAVWPNFTTSGHREHQFDMQAEGFVRSQSLGVEHGYLSDELKKPNLCVVIAKKYQNVIQTISKYYLI